MAVSSVWVFVDGTDRISVAFAFPSQAFIAPKIVERSLVDRMHLSYRRTGSTRLDDAVFAGHLFADCRDLRAVDRVLGVLACKAKHATLRKTGLGSQFRSNNLSQFGLLRCWRDSLEQWRSFLLSCGRLAYFEAVACTCAASADGSLCGTK